MTFHKSFKFRLYPTKEQETKLAKTFGCVRVLWNHNVEIFNSYDKNKSEQNKAKTSTQLRNEIPFLQEVSAAALQQKEIDFKETKSQFFSKSRKKKLGRPTFKSKNNRQSFRLPFPKFGLNEKTIRIEKIGKIKLIQDREIPKDSKFLSVTISKNTAGQYYASILVECEIIKKPKTGKVIGLDIGLKTFLVGSDGLEVDNPQHFRKNQAKLKKTQRHLSRKQKGSHRRTKCRLKVAKSHNKITNQRNHFIHEETAKLVNLYDDVFVEDLNVAGMKRNRKLAKSISDASFSKFYSILEYKCNWYGKNLIKIDRFFPSSKKCSFCDWIDENQTLTDREFRCQSCGLIIDRDLNAAQNILREGLRIKAFGVTSAIRTQSKRKTRFSKKIADCDEVSRMENRTI